MKRVIFALLYDDGAFALSRNFRLQRVGDLRWVLENYHLRRVATALDELMVINVSEDRGSTDDFATVVSRLANECFIPVTAGGGIRQSDDAARLLRAGADKVLVNAAFFDAPDACKDLAQRYGRQFLVAGVDAISIGRDGFLVRHPATRARGPHLHEWLDHVREHGAGEVLLQSVDRDGTGMGIDLGLLESLPRDLDVPLIAMGGVGRAAHLIEALAHPAIDAVATAHIFNFVADTFLAARRSIIGNGIPLPAWRHEDFDALRGAMAAAGTEGASTA